MSESNCLTNQRRVLVYIVNDRGVRLREIATTVGLAERIATRIERS